LIAYSLKFNTGLRGVPSQCQRSHFGPIASAIRRTPDRSVFLELRFIDLIDCELLGDGAP
jgi:hypothetical protein